MHVYTRLNGFGATVLPTSPYEARRVFNSDELELTCFTSAGAARAAIQVHGGVRADPPAMAEVARSGYTGEWRLETRLFSCQWPRGFALLANPGPRAPSKFDLLGQDGALIYVQGPFPLERILARGLVAPGQRVLEEGEREGRSFVEVGYQVEGRDWIQQHILIPFDTEHVLMVTEQSLTAHWAATFGAGETVVETLVTRRPD